MVQRSQATIVIIEDEASQRDALEALCESADYRTLSYDSAEAFLQQEMPPPPCCVLLDLDLPGMNGLELQAKLRETQAAVSIVLLSADTTPAHAECAINAGALDFFTKPFDTDRLLATARRGLQLSLAAFDPRFRDSGLGTRDSGLGTRDSGLGTRQ